MRKIKALHIICPTSPHLLSATDPFPLSAYVSSCCVSLFILIAATVDVLLSQSYNKLLHKLRVPQLGQGEGAGTGGAVSLQGIQWLTRGCIFKMPFASLWQAHYFH